MALSGTFYTNVGSGYRLQLEWSATQDISANTSTITAKLYWMSLGSSYTVNSSATKDGAITIDGTTSAFSGNGLASLSGNEKKLLHTYTKTVTHNSDGTKTVSFSAYFDAQVTLSGTYYDRITVSGSATLDPIPRQSTLASSPSWTAGNDLAISINRSSTSFTHTVKIYVNNTLIKTITGVGTSTTASFSVSENTAIFNQLAQTSSKPSKITIETYDGGNFIGSNDYIGTCSAPNPSTITSSANFNIGDPVSVTISSNNSQFTHTLKFYTGNTLIKTITGVGTSTTWTPSQAEKDSMYATTPNSNTVTSKIECITYYNGVQVQSLTSVTGTATVTNSNPIFNNTFTYRDTNSTTTAVTGNDQYIIQNKSTVLVEIPTSAKATAVNGATMVSYVATLNGVSISQPYSSTNTVSFNFGTINATSDLTLSIKAIDSRGNYTIATKTVTILPYSNPTLTVSATRANNFDSNTTLNVSGSFSTLNIGGTNKNTIQTFQYRYKDTTSQTWGSWTNLTYTTNGSTFSASTTLNLDSAKAWNIDIQIIDKFSTVTASTTVAVGQPIFFIDATKRSIGVNQFPANNSSVEINGNLNVSGNLTVTGTIQGNGSGSSNVTNPNNPNAYVNLGWYNNVARIKYGGTGAGANGGFQILGEGDVTKLTVGDDGTVTVNRIVTGSNLYNPNSAIALNNSDIRGINALWFSSDPSDLNWEGINFIKPGKTAESTNTADYDNLRILDGVLYLNGLSIANTNDKTLWTGAYQMDNTQTVTPSKRLSQCYVGWLLIWSDFDAPSTTNNYDFAISIIPKEMASKHSGALNYFIIPTNVTTSAVTYTIKQLYVYDDRLVGHANNNLTGNNTQDAVLRYVIEI